MVVCNSIKQGYSLRLSIAFQKKMEEDEAFYDDMVSFNGQTPFEKVNILVCSGIPSRK